MPRVAHGVVFLAYSLITLAVTWPLAAHLGSSLGGEIADPAQTLWGFWWWRHSAEFGDTPMFSRLLWWPEGLPLWFQSWDIPSTVAAWPLWGLVPDVAIYNLAVLVTFPLSGLAVYLLSRELWGGSLAPFLAGCLYTFSTYHFAHARMQLHLASMQWAPLLFLALVRLARRQRPRDAILTGVTLALATLASIYYLLFSAVGVLVLTIARPRAERRALVARVGWGRAAVVGVVFLALTGWLLLGMARNYLAEPYLGSHRSVAFSADVQSFFVPNAVSIWSDWFPTVTRWTGNRIETSGYIGYVALGLGLAGAWRMRTARPFLWVAGVGAVLALGPFLHVGGAIPVPLLLPEGWLELLVPPLRMSGMPTRYSWLTTFGVAVAGGAALAHLCQRGRAGRAAAIGLVAVAMVEVWPRPFVLTSWGQPPIFEAWARDAGADWAVMDITPWSRGLWHQMAHRRPMATGYATRTPRRIWEGVRTDPVLGPLLAAQFGGTEPVRVPPDEARRILVGHRIRFIIAAEAQTNVLAALNLPERHRDDGIVIYEVD